MIKATDLIKKETVEQDYFFFKSKNGFRLEDKHYFLCFSCEDAARNLYEKKYSESIKDANTKIALDKILDEREDKIAKLAARFEREFLRASTDFREEDVFHFTLFLQFEPSLKEVMRAFREDITFYGSVNINSINEIKKTLKKIIEEFPIFVKYLIKVVELT
ncbi:hypothetical protein DKL61_09295 [Gammaproteobacteria bacterium ESL0073]|nr:hypothetical protein DKL61_09295 [Gammaproteobacteria bacterium ESL0073]